MSFTDGKPRVVTEETLKQRKVFKMRVFTKYLNIPKGTRILALASYCDDNPDCSKDFPCDECLHDCNVFETTEDVMMQSHGGSLGYLREHGHEPFRAVGEP